MTPDNISTILKSLDRMDTKFDGQAELLHQTRAELREIMVVAKEARSEIHHMNTRVTDLERKEIDRRATVREHDRMEHERDHDAEKWKGIGPNIITGICSGAAVIVVAFFLERI